MSNLTAKDYTDMYCKDVKLSIGSKLYHYAYGELTVTGIERIKTKFNKFNYIVCQIDDFSTLSDEFVNTFKLDVDSKITFREDNINEWLCNDKLSVELDDKKYSFINKIYLR